MAEVSSWRPAGKRLRGRKQPGGSVALKGGQRRGGSWVREAERQGEASEGAGDRVTGRHLCSQPGLC